MSTSITEQGLSKPRTSWNTKILYATIFLIAGTHFFERFTSRYLDNLVQSNQIGRWTLLVDYADIAKPVFLLLELAAVICYFGFEMTRKYSGLLSLQAVRLLTMTSGALGGFTVTLLGLPVLLRLDSHNGFVSLLASRFFGLRSLIILLLLTLILPIASEIVFRGIIFNALLEGTTLTAAVLASSFLFAYAWPVYNPITGFLLGLVTAILFYRSKSLVPGLIANMLVTILGLIILVWQALV